MKLNVFYLTMVMALGGLHHSAYGTQLTEQEYIDTYRKQVLPYAHGGSSLRFYEDETKKNPHSSRTLPNIFKRMNVAISSNEQLDIASTFHVMKNRVPNHKALVINCGDKPTNDCSKRGVHKHSESDTWSEDLILVPTFLGNLDKALETNRENLDGFVEKLFNGHRYDFILLEEEDLDRTKSPSTRSENKRAFFDLLLKPNGVLIEVKEYYAWVTQAKNIKTSLNPDYLMIGTTLAKKLPEFTLNPNFPESQLEFPVCDSLDEFCTRYGEEKMFSCFLPKSIRTEYLDSHPWMVKGERIIEGEHFVDIEYSVDVDSVKSNWRDVEKHGLDPEFKSKIYKDWFFSLKRLI